MQEQTSSATSHCHRCMPHLFLGHPPIKTAQTQAKGLLLQLDLFIILWFYVVFKTWSWDAISEIFTKPRTCPYLLLAFGCSFFLCQQSPFHHLVQRILGGGQDDLLSLQCLHGPPLPVHAFLMLFWAFISITNALQFFMRGLWFRNFLWTCYRSTCAFLTMPGAGSCQQLG